MTDVTSISIARSLGQKLLAYIENRTAYIMKELLQGVNVLLNRPLAELSPSFDRSDHPSVTILEIETQAAHWASAVPPNPPELRAALIHALAEKYAFEAKDVPRLAEILGFDDPVVQESYQKLYDAPLDTAFKPMTAPVIPEETLQRVTEELIRLEMGAKLEWVSLRRGEVLFRQGEEGDSLYIIANGLLRVVLEPDDEEEHFSGAAITGENVLLELGRGDTVGEMAALTGEKRTATVYAVRDSELCKLSRAGFDYLAAQYPAVMMQISLQMMRRVRRMTFSERTFARPMTIAVLPVDPHVPVAEFARRLMTAFSRFGPTLLLNRQVMVQHIPEAQVRALDTYADDYEFVSWLSEQETRYRYIIYEADPVVSGWTGRCIYQADRILLVADADQSPAPGAAESMLHQAEGAKLSARKELVLIHANRDKQPSGTRDWLKPRQVERHHHITLDNDEDYDRIVRFLRGRAVGLVLGAGGLRGSAHAGVGRALEELGIKADIVGGTSVGAIGAAMSAMGFDAQTILEILRREMIDNRAFFDYTLPLVSFNAGRRISKALSRIFGDIDIEDLWIPFFCISGNLSTAHTMVHRYGRLRYYLRASTSLPGIYPPVTDENGDLLIDGGIFNSVPADVMHMLTDGGPVIAIDINHEASHQPRYDFGDNLSGWRYLWSKINPPSKRLKAPGLMHVISRSATLGSVSARAAQLAYADLLLKPPVGIFGLFDAENYDKMYEIGYEYSLRRIAAWKKRGGLEER